MMTHRFAFVAAVALAGCFSPKFKDHVNCGPGGECPPGQQCGTDGKCHAPGEFDAPIDSSQFDGRPDGPPPDAHTPDAKPVGCQGDGDCQTPPDLCELAGTCDLSTHMCTFPAKDCSSLTDECGTGTCQLATGNCVKVPTNENLSCGQGLVCPSFGACGGFANTCANDGTQSRTCQQYACQAGTCTPHDTPQTQACTRNTDGTTCQSTDVAGCGACGGFASTCDESGTMTCTCTTYTCMSGGCQPASSSCTRSCSRNTDGDGCGSVKCPDLSFAPKCCLSGVCGFHDPDCPGC
jgi:hypothetical protein